MSDSFLGVIWKVPRLWRHPQRVERGPAARAGDRAHAAVRRQRHRNNDRTILFVANTAFHQIIQIPVNPDGTTGTASTFITRINAPDGIRIDRDDDIWICANQEDEIVVIDKTGKVIAKLGDFGGIDETASCAGFCSRRAWPSARMARPPTCRT